MDFNDIINDICREFRRLRDAFRDKTEEEFKYFLRVALEDFWKKQPWHTRAFRKPIMRIVYKFLRNIM